MHSFFLIFISKPPVHRPVVEVLLFETRLLMVVLEHIGNFLGLVDESRNQNDLSPQ